MLFNSFEYIFVFLPVAVIGFFFLSRFWGKSAAMAWIITVSLFFYAWWNPVYVFLLLASIFCNFLISLALLRFRSRKDMWLWVGIVFNLSVLFYFKYANFFLQTFGAGHFASASVVLPLGISFITFQKISYLVDIYRNERSGFGFMHYCFFVTFFPQLIAGPIVRHDDIAPQLVTPQAFRFQGSNLAVGLTIFILGLWKKVVFADSIALYATPIFHAADAGISMNFFESWMGVLAYALQLYFDFSGYADMAIGTARLFGIQLPINFLSPYKSRSIIEFWRTWHITLSNYLRDYLYIPLGGNRRGALRRYVNLFLTMLIGGLWHGAGWTFVFWGALHGFYLVVNHLWRSLSKTSQVVVGSGRVISSFFSWLLTFFCILIAWVFFRAETFAGALNLLSGMMGLHAIALPKSFLAHIGVFFREWMPTHGFRFDLTEIMVLRPDTFSQGIVWICILFAVILFAPNTQEFMGHFLPIINPEKHPAPQRKSFFHWSPTTRYAFVTAMLGLTSFASLMLLQKTEFLYFQF
jgi:D-alanyl-lipoteichoic acid acyltransferase DltB (MBOAT superfamily)